jgi:hypothetical protein
VTSATGGVQGVRVEDASSAGRESTAVRDRPDGRAGPELDVSHVGRP